MTVIYYTFFDKRLPSDSFKGYVASLPWNIRERITRFRRWQDAHACLFGRLLLKKVIDVFALDYSLDELKFTKYQRPYFPSNFIDFNISHSGDFVVCAASDRVRLGVDIEEIKSINISDFKGQFHEQEWCKIIESGNMLNTFYEYWTKKEAIIKAEGMGLSIPLNLINLADAHGGLQINTIEWIIKEIQIEISYKCAIATSENIDGINPLYIEF